MSDKAVRMIRPTDLEVDPMPAIDRVLRIANRKFDVSIAAMSPQPIKPEPTPMEALGRIVRQFNDATLAMAAQFRRGYERG